MFTDPGGLWPHTPSSAYLHTLADIAGYVAVGTVAAALVVGAPLTAPLVGATLLATGAVMLAADVVHATGTCTSSKGNCGTALAMAGVAAAGGRYLRPLRALKTVRNSRPATLTPTTTGGPGPLRAGREGLARVGVTQNTTRIESLTGTARYRVPDVLDPRAGVIGEVKNVSSLSYTSQLRDYALYAQKEGLDFVLHVRPTTRLSGPLAEVIQRGDIMLRYLP